MKKLRDYEKEKLEEMLDGQGWKVFLSILEEEKEEKKNLLVSYIANGEVEKAQKEALKVQYIDYLINKPKNILKKNVGKKEEEKSKYNQYEEDIVNGLLE